VAALGKEDRAAMLLPGKVAVCGTGVAAKVVLVVAEELTVAEGVAS